MKLNCQNVWDECLNQIKLLVDDTAFINWFKPIVPYNLKGNVLTIQVPNYYFYEVIEEQYISIVSTALRKVVGKNAKLNYTLASTEGYKEVSQPATSSYGKSSSTYSYNKNNGGTPIRLSNPFEIPGAKQLDIDPQLNLEYNFENFIEGECNRLARAAGLSITENPGSTTFNPLYIYMEVREWVKLILHKQ